MQITPSSQPPGQSQPPLSQSYLRTLITAPHWHQDPQGTDLGRNRCRRPPRRLIVRIHPHPRPSPHPEPLEPHDPPRPLPVPVEQRRRQRPPDNVRMRLPRLCRELQVGLAGIRISDRKLNPDRRRVAEHQRHRGAPFAKVTRQLVLERSRLDHLPQPRHHIAEVQILRGIPEDDRLAKQTDRARLEKHLPVDAAQGDRPRMPLLDDPDRSTQVIRQAERVRKVVERPHRNDAERMLRVRQLAHDVLDGAVPTGDHHLRLPRDQWLEVTPRVAVADAVVGERLPQAGLNRGGYRPRAAAEDQQLVGLSHATPRMVNVGAWPRWRWGSSVWARSGAASRAISPRTASTSPSTTGPITALKSSSPSTAERAISRRPQPSRSSPAR